MADRVGYFDNDVQMPEEGPFVIVSIGGYRVENVLPGRSGCNCVLPDHSVYLIMKELGYEGKTLYRDKAEAVADRLNEMVKEGKIAFNGNLWKVVS